MSDSARCRISHGGADQRAAQRVLGDLLGVLEAGRGERGVGDQRVQVDPAADGSQGAAELACDGQLGVGAVALVVDLEDRVEDLLVDRLVEVRSSEGGGDVVDDALVEHHRAEDARLGGVVVGDLIVHRWAASHAE
jgi:hypothetical protein